jgi:hypothetical protein
MKFVLLLVFSQQSTSRPIAVEFPTLAACEAAGKQVVESDLKNATINIRWTCLAR